MEMPQPEMQNLMVISKDRSEWGNQKFKDLRGGWKFESDLLRH